MALTVKKLKLREKISISSRRQIGARKIQPWGISAAIDLHDCAHDRLTSPELIKEFIRNVISLTGMVAHGPCYIDRFGEGNLKGYSAMQFIKTSSITVHLDEVENRAFIDIFSCKDFDTKAAAAYAQKFFQAEQVKKTVLSR